MTKIIIFDLDDTLVNCKMNIPQNKLLIPKRLLIKIKDQDFKTQKFIEKVNNILDKYNNCLTLNFDQLIEFKEIFQLSYELTNDSTLRFCC